MTQVVGTVFDSNTTSATHSITVPAGVTLSMTGLFVIGTGSSTAVTTTLSRSGSTFTKLDEQNAVNTRVAVWSGTGLAAGNTVTLTLSSAQAVTVAHYYQDDYTFTSGSLSAALRSSSTNTTTSGSVTPSSGQRVVVVGVERTTTATTLSSVTSSGGESVTNISYGEGTGTAQASVYAGSFLASAAASRTATISYSNSSGNGYAALILTTAGSGGGGGGGGGATTPGALHNIGKGGGLNHFNLGVGYPSGHVDITENALESGFTEPGFYELAPGGTGVLMSAPLDGGTTSSNTQYPRVEYRELQPGGAGDSSTPKAAWSGSSGTHYLRGRSRVLQMPPNKPQLVLAQTHDASDDTSMIRLSSKTKVEFKLGDTVVASAAHVMGQWYDWMIKVVNGDISWYWGNLSTPVATRVDGHTASGYYFKFGCYAQSNDSIDAVDDGPFVVEVDGFPECWHTGYAAPAIPASAPTVNAGDDAAVAVGSTFGRTAVEASSSPITIRTWKIQSGPAGVGSTIDTDQNLSWTPTTAGSYVLRYSATNATGTGFDDIAVTVSLTEPGGGGGGGTTTDYEEKFLDGVPWPVITRQSTVVNVSGGSALASALAAASSGQRITLASGSYTGTYTLQGKSNVTVQASTLGGPTFGSGSQLTIKDCTNVLVEGLNWTTDSAIEAVNIRGACRNVQLTQCTIGPSSAAVSSSSSGQYIYISDTAELIRIDFNLLRNKGTAGNNVKVYGNDSVGQVNQHVLVDHNVIIGVKPELANGKEPARHGVSTMSKSMSFSTYCRNYWADCLAEPELFSGKAGGLLVYGNTFFRCAGGGVLRHGTDCVMSDNYFIDGVNTTASAGLKSGGIRFYDSGHQIEHNYMDGLAGSGFQASLLIDRGDAEGSSTALANHWRVIDAVVNRNVILNSATPIVVWNGSQYSLNPSNVAITDNLTVNTTQAGPIVFNGSAALVSSPAPSGNVHYATTTAGGFTQDSDGIWRKPGYGPRLTYVKQSDVGPAGAMYGVDGAGTALAGGGSGTTAPAVNAGADVQVLIGQSVVRTATEVGAGITTRKWTLESGPGVSTPTGPTTPTAPAANLFVATTGNDSNAGTSPNAPKRTLSAALSAASAGQIIDVAPGTYTGNFTTSKGGTSGGGYITLRSSTRHAAAIVGACLIQHQYFKLQDFEITGASVVFACDVTANNTTVQGCKIHGVAKSTPSGDGGSGIEVYSADGNYGPMSNVVIDGNEVFDIGLAPGNNQLQQGIYFTGNGQGTCIVRNNLVYDACDFGLHGYTSGGPGITSNWVVVNNTVVGNGRGILTTGACTVRNNISFNNQSDNYDIRAGGTLSNNLSGGTGNTTGSGITGGVNPLFVNSSTSGSGDFRLQPTSPALNAGTTTNAPPTDILGVTRPQGTGIDIGAYETSTTSGGGGGTPTGAVLSTTETLAWTPTLTGTYVLRYAATNSAGTGVDDITVTVGTGGASSSAPTFVAVGAASSGESNTVELAAPVGSQVGDFALAVILSAGAESITAAPAGWALLRQADVVSAAGDPGGPCTVWLYSATTSSSSASGVWTKSGTRVWHGVRVAYRGQSSLGATAVTAETGSSTSHPTPAVTPARANSRVVGIAAADYLNATVGPFTPPAGWTERYDQTVTSGTENESITIADFAGSAVSTTGTFTSALADQAAVFAVVLEGPVSEQAIALEGIPSRAELGSLTISLSGPAQTISLPGIGSLLQLGRPTVSVAAAAQTILLRGIPPR